MRAPPTNEETRTLCRIGEGADTCRYLTMGAHGWSCEKLSSLKAFIDKRVADGEFTAQGDNCEGKGTGDEGTLQ